MFEVRYSATEEFLTCRRKYFYNYVEKLERAHRDESYISLADVGTAFHAGMAALYLKQDGRAALQQAIAEAGLSGQLVKVGSGTVDAGLCATGLYNRASQWCKYSDFDEGMTTVMVEERLELELALGLVINGMPDRVDEDAYGGLHIRDWKSVGVYTNFNDYSEMNRQMLTYAILVEAATGKTVQSATLLQVHRNPPKSNPLPVNPLTDWFTEKQKQSHKENLTDVLLDMVGLETGETVAYPHPEKHCKWCPFSDLCLATDADPARAVELRKTNYRVKKEQ